MNRRLAVSRCLELMVTACVLAACRGATTEATSPAVAITIDPATVTVPVRGTYQSKVVVTGSAGAGVSLSVEEPDGGTISPAGL